MDDLISAMIALRLEYYFILQWSDSLDFISH